MSELERYDFDHSADSNFSLPYYEHLVRQLRTGRQLIRFVDLPDRPKGMKVSLLRHDVDIDLATAAYFAAMERDELFTRSTYFLRPDAATYNLGESTDLVDEIWGRGHEIGLHYSPKMETSTIKQLERDIVDTADEMEQVLQVGIHSFSIHRPDASGHIIGGPLYVGHLINAYASELTDPEESALYVSDSRATWRFGDPIEILQARQEARTVQVLTHPYWWVNRGQRPRDVYIRTLAELSKVEQGAVQEVTGRDFNVAAALSELDCYDIE